MKVPILSGVFVDADPGVRIAYPTNLQPVAQPSGVSDSFLKPGDGIVSDGTGPGVDRGGILWNDVCYRVMGSKLVSVSSAGTVTTLGEVGGSKSLVTLDYSFDRLAIACNEDLFYWDGTTLTQVTDSDLGKVIDMKWIDGYFMTTDGENLVVTELADPTLVSATKYGSSEIDPDPIEAILKLRNEIYALNRYTIEIFYNVGGSGFPFARKEGAQIQKGCVGTHACCVYLETIAFVGSGRNEQIGVYIGSNSVANKVSTLEIDRLLENYTEAELAQIKVEARNDKVSQLLYIHLPDRTVVYDHASSTLFSAPVWFILSSAIGDVGIYRARNFVYGYGSWLVGDPSSSAVGHLSDTVGTHWGSAVTWSFHTAIVYNDAMGAIFNYLELIALTGQIALGASPSISTSYSIDGRTWSQDKSILAGKIGDRAKRLAWFSQGFMRRFRIQRFTGDSSAHVTFLALEARLEPLGN